MMKFVVISCIILLVFACSQKSEKSKSQGDWITGTEQEQIKTIEKQFRGFDNAMVETGYRYQELYWAGQDQNWEYAGYQIDKIKIAIENGLERRPNRANSSDHFLNNALPEMKNSVLSKDTAIFNSGFQALTISCNACHAMEKVAFFNVQIPTVRQSPIKK